MLAGIQLFETLRTVAHQAPPSMGFSRQEHWSGLPCPPPGDLPNSGAEAASPASPALAGGFFTTSVNWEAHTIDAMYKIRNSENLRSSSCSVVTQMGRKSKKEGMYVYIQLIHFAVQEKLTQHCKATPLHLKLIKNKQKIKMKHQTMYLLDL